MAPSHLSIGIVLYPQFEVLDVQGPLEALNVLARQLHDVLSLSLIARTIDPISAGPIPPDTTSATFAGRQFYLPTHTFQNAPALDVLLVPGGLGALTPLPSGAPADMQDAIAFIRDRFAGLKFLITVCTGAGLAAQAGVLDGLRATANKLRFQQVAQLGPGTYWVGRARWVVDGKVWSTSGVSAGIDGVVAWIAEVFGEDVADGVCANMEYERRKDAWNDVFGDMYAVEDILPTE